MFGYFVYDSFLLKKKYSLSTYITTGIFFPLLLYKLKWSVLIEENESVYFLYTFFALTLIYIIYHLCTRNMYLQDYGNNERIIINKNGLLTLTIINYMFIVLYLLENYLGSGHIIPTLMGIDIHTYSASFISYFTTSFYCLCSLNYFAYKATTKKKFILWIMIIFLIPVLTRASRMQMLIATVSFLSLVLFIESSYSKFNNEYRKKFKNMRYKIVIMMIIFLFALVALTTYRMNHFGIYSLVYSDTIGYSGPELFEPLSPYYGYFPLSFNNLNINMLNMVVDHNYIGIYSFPCLYFSILRLHNIFDLNQYQYLDGNYMTSTSATVPTGFWEFYYDFGILCFIPIMLAMCITYLFYKLGSEERKHLTFRTLYFWYTPLWFFQSFQNVLFASTFIVHAIIIGLLVSNMFYVKKDLTVKS